MSANCNCNCIRWQQKGKKCIFNTNVTENVILSQSNPFEMLK